MGTQFDWTFAVAMYAALVSTGLLIVRILEYRRDNGLASVATSFQPATEGFPATLTLFVANRGSGDFTVQRVDLWGPGPVSIPLVHGDLISSGSELPFRLEPRSSAVWHIDAGRLKSVLRANGWQYQVRGVITLATGKRVWESIHEYTTVH
jgi:hypothetical protein